MKARDSTSSMVNGRVLVEGVDWCEPSKWWGNRNNPVEREDILKL